MCDRGERGPWAWPQRAGAGSRGRGAGRRTLYPGSAPCPKPLFPTKPPRIVTPGAQACSLSLSSCLFLKGPLRFRSCFCVKLMCTPLMEEADPRRSQSPREAEPASLHAIASSWEVRSCCKYAVRIVSERGGHL